MRWFVVPVVLCLLSLTMIPTARAEVYVIAPDGSIAGRNRKPPRAESHRCIQASERKWGICHVKSVATRIHAPSSIVPADAVQPIAGGIVPVIAPGTAANAVRRFRYV